MGRGAFPQYTLGERVADGTIHVISVAASVVALTALLIIGIADRDRAHGGGFRHLWRCARGDIQLLRRLPSRSVRPRVKEILRRLDHAAIFLMIAGDLHALRLDQDEQRLGAWPAGRGVDHGGHRHRHQAVPPALPRRAVDGALSGAGLGGACRLGAAAVGAAGDAF